jgi:hypothetical protein
MDLPTLYRKDPEKIHTASDGQKFEVRTDSLNASRSFKYFGKEQGVSVYTFMDERHLLWHSLVCSASERESAYVIDGLMRNDVVKAIFIPPIRMATVKRFLVQRICLVSPTRLASRISKSNVFIYSVPVKKWIDQTGLSIQINTLMTD